MQPDSVLLGAQQAVTRAFLADGSAQHVRSAVMRALTDELAFDFSAVWVKSPESGRISCADTYTRAAHTCVEFRTLTQGISFAPGAGLAGAAWASGLLAWVEDAPSDPNYLRASAADRAGLRTVVQVPCPGAHGMAAVIELHSLKRRAPEPPTIALLEDVGRQLGQWCEREERLVRRRLMLAAADATPDVIALLDPLGFVMELNDAGRRMAGFPPGEIPPDRRLPMPDWAATQLIATALPAVAAGAPWSGESALRDPRGRDVPVLLTLVPHRNAEGALHHVSAWFRDVGAFVAGKRRAWQAEKLDALSRLSGAMANDFNNLLTVISGYSHLVAESLTKDDPRRQQLDELDSAARQAAALVHQLGPLVTAGTTQRTPVDAVGLIHDMTRLLRTLAGTGNELSITEGDEVGFVHADPVQIEQVLVNLVLNARDALPRGGRIDISLTNVRAPGPGVGDRVPPGRYVLLTVTDNGIGMDETTRSRLFEPFFTTKPHSRGLGLAAVFGTVKQLGGHVQVDSEPGRGSTFRTYLPRIEAASVPVPDPNRSRDWNARNETVLLVDDEAGVRALARRALDRHGYLVLEAEHGDAALEVCKRHPGPIHLLITDVVMPGLDGRELAEQIQRLRPDVRVLYVSGHAESNAELIATPAGAALLPKPFVTGMLLEAVRAVLDRAPYRRVGR
jgi:two-component system cell cycle sensor histidine kinase/response regulator CckA